MTNPVQKVEESMSYTWDFTEERLEEIRKAPREAMIAKAEAERLIEAMREKISRVLDPSLNGTDRRASIELKLRSRARFDGCPRVEEKLLIGEGWTTTSLHEAHANAVSDLTLALTELEMARIRICELETICDPAGHVQTIASQREQIDGLLAKLNETNNGFMSLKDAVTQ